MMGLRSLNLPSRRSHSLDNLLELHRNHQSSLGCYQEEENIQCQQIWRERSSHLWQKKVRNVLWQTWKVRNIPSQLSSTVTSSRSSESWTLLFLLQGKNSRISLSLNPLF